MRTFLTHVPRLSLSEEKQISQFFLPCHEKISLSMEKALNLVQSLQIWGFYDEPFGHSNSFSLTCPKSERTFLTLEGSQERGWIHHWDCRCYVMNHTITLYLEDVFVNLTDFFSINLQQIVFNIFFPFPLPIIISIDSFKWQIGEKWTNHLIKWLSDKELTWTN